MSITRSAIRNDRVTFVVIGVLLLSGVLAYGSMPQQMDPGFIVRTAQIVTRFAGASPDRVESLVTDPIEQAVQSIPELDFVSSTSRTGVSVVAVNIRQEFSDMRPIWDAVRRKIETVEKDLPEGADPPEINDELGDTYPMLFSMTGDGVPDREMTEIGESIRDQLLHMEGVGKVEIMGEQDERIFLDYSDSKLSQMGLSPGQLQQILRKRNIIMPGGQIDIGPETLALEPSGNFGSVEELGKTLVTLRDGSVVSLRDITAIRRGYIDPPRSVVTVEGHRGLTFAVSMSDGDNLVDLGRELRAFFEGLPAHYPHGIDFALTYFQPKDVEAKVHEFSSSVMQAVGIVLLVMLLTLGLRTGLIVSSLIPAAMVITIWILSLTGESINQMSLAALIIALGLLVDNAIVVSESIMVRLSKGEDRVEAAVGACGEMQLPLLVSSLTTAAAFLPIYLAESQVGEYTGALFSVVSITLLVSWALAITMVPLLCTRFMKVAAHTGNSFDNAFYRSYRGSLGLVLRWKKLSALAVVGMFAASLPLWGLVPNIFFPAQDAPFFMADVSLSPGANIAGTRQMAAELDSFIETELRAKEGGDGVTSWTTFIGETPPPFTLGYTPSPSQGGYCELMVHTTTKEVVPALMERLQRFVLERFPDAKPNIRMLSAGPPVDKPVQIRVSGTDTDRIFSLVDGVRAKLTAIAGTRNVAHDWGARVKKIVVTVDEDRARGADITNEDVALSMRAFLSGTETTRYREDDKSIPVIVRSEAQGRRDLNRVRNLSVASQRTGASVPLSQLADVSLAWEPAKVLRRDRYRTVTVESAVEPGVTAMEIFSVIEPWLKKEAAEWGLGYRWEFGGEMESSVKANQSIGDKLPIAALVIIMLLVSQFNSIRKPLIILSTIVLALVGVVIGLVVMRSSFGFMTLLGVVSLAGIVVNNAIVLLDRVQLEIDDNGRSPREAVIEAGQQRARPILLTTATTVASLIPLYIAGGAMWQPMAVAIMFGLVFSTMLTLLVVPLLYLLMYPTPAPSTPP